MAANQPETLVTYLRTHCGLERPAVQTGALTLSYGDLIGLIDAVTAQLCNAGLQGGDRVLMLLPNGVEHIVGVLATIAAGAIVIPLDAEAGSGRLADAVLQTSPHVCVTGASQAIPAGMRSIRLQIDPATFNARCTLEGSVSAPGSVGATDEQIAFIRFTSGSTGHAKGVVLMHEHQLWTARTLSERFGINSDHRELVLVSMALSGGWQRVAATLYAGGCVIIGEKPLSVAELLDTLIDFRVTGFFTPPPLVRMLLASPANKVGAAMRACHTVEIGSAAIMADELRAFVALLPNTRVYVHYGLTECSRAVVLDATGHPDKLATVGRPLDAVELKICNEAGEALAANRSGQILLRGPQLTRGYWRQPELNRERFVDGWLATGDYGFLDQDGFLTLLGRQDDLINCGGHCYFPGEVEQVLGTFAGIEHYLIAGVPDPRGVLQDVPWAFVVPVDPDEWLPREFLALARQRLPAHMVPRQVVVIPELPLTASGKPDRRETARIYGSSTVTNET